MNRFLDSLTAALGDRYPIQSELGRGGMASVYLARDLRHNRPVAVKVLDPGLAESLGTERFLREIKVTAALEHPNILPLHDSGVADGYLYYVMPHIQGGSLRDRLQRERRLGIDEGVAIAVAVAEALEFAHQHGVIHRDLKPENILLHHGRPLLADFGIARDLLHPAHLTGTGLGIGTPRYMSPEQLRADPALDQRTDVFALGSVLYEMLTGEPPFPGATVAAIVAAQLLGPAPSVRRLRADVPPQVEHAIAKAIERESAARHTSAAAFRDAILSNEAARTHDATTVGMITPVARSAPAPAQVIRFCTAKDGTRIAYATVGAGPPLVKAAHWLTHIEYEWDSLIWRHWLHGLSAHNTLVRYDQRGCGLSDRDVDDLSLEAFVDDLEQVVEAAGLERFSLLGVSQGGPIAIAYTVRHPDRVSHLILHGSYARGSAQRPNASPEMIRTQLEMVRLGWGMDNPAFRQAFSMMFFPDASAEQLASFSELQRVTSSPEASARLLQSHSALNVTELSKQVRVPTLVMHSRHEVRCPFEEGTFLAGLIPGARLVPLASRNHIPLENEPAWQRFLDELYGFLGVA